MQCDAAWRWRGEPSVAPVPAGRPSIHLLQRVGRSSRVASTWHRSTEERRSACSSVGVSGRIRAPGLPSGGLAGRAHGPTFDLASAVVGDDVIPVAKPVGSDESLFSRRVLRVGRWRRGLSEPGNQPTPSCLARSRGEDPPEELTLPRRLRCRHTSSSRGMASAPRSVPCRQGRSTCGSSSRLGIPTKVTSGDGRATNRSSRRTATSLSSDSHLPRASSTYSCSVWMVPVARTFFCRRTRTSRPQDWSERLPPLQQHEVPKNVLRSLGAADHRRWPACWHAVPCRDYGGRRNPGADFARTAAWLAYVSNQISGREVYVQEFPKGEQRQQDLDERRHAAQMVAQGRRTLLHRRRWPVDGGLDGGRPGRPRAEAEQTGRAVPRSTGRRRKYLDRRLHRSRPIRRGAGWQVSPQQKRRGAGPAADLTSCSIGMPC